MNGPRLLLVAGASLVGQNVLAALAGRRARLRVATTGSVADDPFLFDGDAAYLTPPTADVGAFERRLAEILAAEDPDLVIPCRDDDVVLLAALRERRPELASRLLCGTLAAARIMMDKWASSVFASEHALPYAPSIIAGGDRPLADFAREHGFPLVAKPRSGFGSQGVFLVCDERQLLRAAAADGYLFQQYLGDAGEVTRFRHGIEDAGVPLFHSFEGRKLSIQALIAPDGSIVGPFCTRHTMRQGRSDRVETEAAAELLELGERCARAFAAAHWRGPLNVQCQRAPDGRVFIHEFNGRFTGATAARHLLGFDEVGLALARFTGRAMPEPAVPTMRAREVVRVPLSRAVDPTRVATLVRAGVWRRGESEALP